MVGLLDFLTGPSGTYDGATGADSIGLLGRALAGFGAGLNSGPRGLVNQGGVLMQYPSTNWGNGFAGMAEGYSQGQQDLNRRMLTGATMKNYELSRKKTEADLARDERERAAKEEYTAAINSGDPARISAARARLNPDAVYQEKYGEKPLVPVGPGQSLYNPRTGKADFTAPDKPALTEDIKNYNLAKSEGYKGTFQQWTREQRAPLAPPTPTDDMRELEVINRQRTAAGQPPMTMEQLYRVKRGSDPMADMETRKAQAAQLGLDPKSPQYQSYVLTGKMPREDMQPLTATDKKAIMEADEAVLSAQNAIGSLERALKLSEQAYEGPTAGARGYVTSLFGSKAGEATTDMTNEVTTNALSQMKAIFGGNPTEGERQVLLDIQGSASQPHEVRKKIFERAKMLAERRLQFNKQRSDELRGGTFYKPGGASAAPANAPDPLGIR